MSDRDQIIEGLRPLIDQAEKEGKWLHCSYHDIWFSPAELRKENAKGHFLWGAVNWRLRCPVEELEYLEREVESAREAGARFKERMGQAGKKN